jgi:hypothetical protein
LHDNGKTKRRVELGDVTITELPELPSLAELEGTIVGVGFDPGRNEVRIKADSQFSSWDATDEQVDTALNMRRTTVRVLGVNDGKRVRLVTMARASAPRFQVTPEAIDEHIFKKWSGAFKRLANK